MCGRYGPSKPLADPIGSVHAVTPRSLRVADEALKGLSKGSGLAVGRTNSPVFSWWTHSLMPECMPATMGSPVEAPSRITNGCPSGFCEGQAKTSAAR